MDTIVNFFQQGGVFMYIILSVFVIGLVIAIERYFFLASQKKVNKTDWEKLYTSLKSGSLERTHELASSGASAVAKMIEYGLSRHTSGRRKDDIQIAMEEGLMEISPQLEKRTPYIALLANIATLLGLLGTIMGLIDAFTAVANANAAEKADLLSQSISVAMNTTALGLMVGIPLLLVHAFILNKTTSVIDSLEMVSVKTLNAITQAEIDGK